ncbi:MAG TPA: hypothetical protein VG015_09125 [Candidatus Dormibacteraeota bacterium]|jgi:hypothetical protein|nr:hypothetical protein [Candidatus Dormibacteraeota bacterium]
MVEFAFAAVPFMTTIFISLAIVVHTLEQEVAVNAAARGAREAVLASETNLDCADYDRAAIVADQTLGGALFGTKVSLQGSGALGADGCNQPKPCPPTQVAHVEICFMVDGARNITVAVKGEPAGLIPGWIWPLDEEATGHLAAFQP